MKRYRSEDDDSARWEGFPFRKGDIVVSTRSKHGTTWVQMILLLLIHQSPELPASLVELSPWMDSLLEPRDEVIARLKSQDTRRVIKTHTPLDGIPVVDEATYVVVGRHPLDAAVSFYHQVVYNVDRQRQAEFLDGEEVETPPPPPLEEWLATWIDREGAANDPLETLPKVMWHLTDAWGEMRPPRGRDYGLSTREKTATTSERKRSRPASCPNGGPPSGYPVVGGEAAPSVGPWQTATRDSVVGWEGRSAWCEVSNPPLTTHHPVPASQA